MAASKLQGIDNSRLTVRQGLWGIEKNDHAGLTAFPAVGSLF